MDFFEITDREHLLAKYESDWSRLKGIIDGSPVGYFLYSITCGIFLRCRNTSGKVGGKWSA